MIRGTFILICKDKVLESTEFNGGMDLKELGFEVIETLERVETEDDFTTMIEDFNNAHYGYKEELIYEKNDFYDGEKFVNLNIDFFGRFFSDYLYIKNISNKEITFLDRNQEIILLIPDHVEGFDFGKHIETLYEASDIANDIYNAIQRIWNSVTDIISQEQMDQIERLHADEFEFLGL